MVKRFIGLIMVLLTCQVGFGQLDTVFNGYGSPFRITSDTTFQLKFINEQKTFSNTDADTNCILIVEQGGRCYTLPINEITSTASGNIVGKTTLPGAISSGYAKPAAILRPTETKNLYPYISGLPDELQSCIEIHNQLILDTLSLAGIGGGTTFPADSILFDSDRNILRVPVAGTNIGGSTVYDWLNWWYFTPPTISLAQSPSTTVFEIGTETSITYTSTTTNSGSATLSNGSLFVVSPSAELDDFAATTSGSATIDFTPLQTPVDTFDSYQYQFRATQDWVSGGESGTATSNTRTINAVYPVFYGMVADTATAFADIYNTMTKLVQAEGNKTVSFTGSGLIFYCMPSPWSDTNLSSIIDPNGFNVTSSFTRVTYPTVTSDDLTNDYVNVGCTCYFLNTGSTTTSGSNYTFNR